MKKLTDKDAILCVSIEEAIAIRDKFKLYEMDNACLKDGLRSNEKICLYEDSCFTGIRYAKENGYKIIKAYKILNKGVSKKELLRRIEKLEKVMIDNTEVSVSKSVEELPEKWCIKITEENIPYLNEYLNNQKSKYKGSNEYWEVNAVKAYFLSENKKECFHSTYKNPKGYIEITFDEFKKLVLKEEEKTLSIREVQVKVTSQEEANECAEIAKSCGEKLDFEGKEL